MLCIQQYSRQVWYHDAKKLHHILLTKNPFIGSHVCINRILFGHHCSLHFLNSSRQDSYTSSCGSFLSPSQYDGTASDMGSCYDIMEDEEALSVSPTQQTLPENEMADLDVEMCEKKQVRLKYALILHTTKGPSLAKVEYLVKFLEIPSSLCISVR